MTTIYIGHDEVTDLQNDIMLYVDFWVKTQKTPVPQREVVNEMKKKGIKDFTTANALNQLMKKGYLRKAFSMSKKTKYVQLRRVFLV